jgi:hypothetical protein
LFPASLPSGLPQNPNVLLIRTHPNPSPSVANSYNAIIVLGVTFLDFIQHNTISVWNGVIVVIILSYNFCCIIKFLLSKLSPFALSLFLPYSFLFPSHVAEVKRLWTVLRSPCSCLK